jgi:serine phosphatase RsbU (regulator of sigma subunit)
VTVSIRSKLALLAAVPVVGAAILSAQIVSHARAQVKLAEALGSIESLVELSERTTTLIHDLESERTSLCLATGYRRSEGHKDGVPTKELAGAVQQVKVALARTDAARDSLDQFLVLRNESALPKKLRDSLTAAQRELRGLDKIRRQLDSDPVNWEELIAYYEHGIRDLTGTVAGLSELSNDGELLRIFNALVAILQLEAQASAEHALMAHVLVVGEFPPGSYRKLVTTITQEDVYQDAFVTVSTYRHRQLYDELLSAKHIEPVKLLRSKLMNVADDDLTDGPATWLSVGQPRLEAMARFETLLHADSQRLAAQKLRDTKRDVMIGMALAGSILLFSVVFAGLLAHGITRRLGRMRHVVARVGEGDLSVRVDVSNQDELGHLGTAFNTMIGEIGESRLALAERARMARDLEIAAEIQRAMLPKTPSHPEFEFAGNMVPADEVGGDFYDVLTDGSALWLTVGDVCGHGIGSGLVMVMTQVAFASGFIADSEADPAQVWRQVNRLLCDNIRNRLGDNRYVTAQLLAYRGKGRFHCVGAHQWPIVYRQSSGQCEIYESTGPWLGVAPDQIDVPSLDIVLEPGDVLCLYSDGLPESQDGSGELFDVDRMQSTLAQSMQRHGTVVQASIDLFAAVEAYSGRRDDDWTMLLVRRK